MQDENKYADLPIIPVILAGGAGTRLWPLSRSSYPKQFLPLNDATGKHSLFQQTLLRVNGLRVRGLNINGLNASDNPIIVAGESHRFIALDQLHELGQPADIILEPMGKNTAVSLTLAALQATQYGSSTSRTTKNPAQADSDAVLMVLPADHAIADDAAFCQSLSRAITEVKKTDNCIVTLGIKPTRAETGYGYIEIDNTQADVAEVRRFVEKPDNATAQSYLTQGDFYWNAGIFVLKASTWLAACEVYAEQLYSKTKQAWAGRQYDSPFLRPDTQAFAHIPSNSIDYAVIEHLPDDCFALKMLPLDAGWNDLGSWQSVAELPVKDAAANSVAGDALLHEASNCFVQANSRLVALLGVQDLVVVETPDAVLVANQDACQDVKAIVNELNAKQKIESERHRKVHRPWGWYDSIDAADRFKVKRICVKPKASLSLQMHHHRAEHWVVVKGTAEVTCGDTTLLLSENESTFIPLGVKHRLANPGNIPLEIIEVQSGSYLEEDDIVRYDDVYGRG